MPPEQLPPEEENVELEAIAHNGIEGNEIAKDTAINTEASAIKLNEIEQNQEAQLVQSMKSTKDMIETIAPSLKAQERLANITTALLTNLEGPPGKTPEKGKDYFTDEEIAAFLNQVTPKKGEDYFTAQEIKAFREAATPKKGVDYRDGKDGVDGVDGEDAHNPMTVSKTQPKGAQVGDMWYQP